MKFCTKHIDNYIYLNKIEEYKLTAIYFSILILFFKNGKLHNKKAALIRFKYKEFYLNGKYYDNSKSFY